MNNLLKNTKRFDESTWRDTVFDCPTTFSSCSISVKVRATASFPTAGLAVVLIQRQVFLSGAVENTPLALLAANVTVCQP